MAIPVEYLASEGADCEDYAIGKYFGLNSMGIQCRACVSLMYVRCARTRRILLAYCTTADSGPYILDNLSSSVSLVFKRKDLVPVYSFNDEDLWLPGVSAAGGKSSQIRLWQGLLEKMQKERAM